MKIEIENFGQLPCGEQVLLFRFSCDAGSYFEVTNYGATWISAVVPDKNGALADVILGFDNIEAYMSDISYMGSTVGRFANRIANGSFVLNGHKYSLEKNDGKHSNHGGYSGFHRRLFQYRLLESGVEFSLVSKDGEGGYPGNLSVKVSYCFNENNSLSIIYEARSDKDTFVNLTNHAYFNLRGEGTVGAHRLYIPSLQVLKTDEQFIPTGGISNVQNSDLDFSQGKTIDAALLSKNFWLQNNRGLNHCYVLTPKDNKLKSAAELLDPESCRTLKVSTTYPSVIVYSSGFLNPEYPGKNDKTYVAGAGICFETQSFPDYPNHPEFLLNPLKAGDKYEHQTNYIFGINNERESQV